MSQCRCGDLSSTVSLPGRRAQQNRTYRLWFPSQLHLGSAKQKWCAHSFPNPRNFMMFGRMDIVSMLGNLTTSRFRMFRA